MTDSIFRAYTFKNLDKNTLALVSAANQIIREYHPQSLTIRQIFYQFVGRGLLPNDKRSYGLIQSIVKKGRLNGLISWTAIEDRTRGLVGLEYETKGPIGAIEGVKNKYRCDLWARQPIRPEIWIEKDALIGVIGDICVDLRVDYFACRGYSSLSEQWRAGRRLANYIIKGQRPIVFHLGDHDPSGIDMTRDNARQLARFAGVPVQVTRLALNWDQIQRYTPPPNYAKVSDSRATEYISRYGTSCWELDALDPKVIVELIRNAVEQVRDEKIWEESLSEESEDLETLDEIIQNLGKSGDGGVDDF